MTDSQLPVARIIPSSRCADGSGRSIYAPEITSWKQYRECALCKSVFAPRFTSQKWQRFCGTSCSAKWRMRDKTRAMKCHTPDARAKRVAKFREWILSDDPSAKRQMDRIRNMNPSTDPEVRIKISRRLKEIGHGPSVRGGNGRPLPAPQARMLDYLGASWISEYAVSLGPKTPGYPTCYKLDLADPERRIGIEADGASHRSRRALDQKKDAKLASLGWTVLRFNNQDILDWIDSGMPKNASISATLARHGIRIIPLVTS